MKTTRVCLTAVGAAILIVSSQLYAAPPRSGGGGGRGGRPGGFSGGGGSSSRGPSGGGSSFSRGSSGGSSFQGFSKGGSSFQGFSKGGSPGSSGGGSSLIGKGGATNQGGFNPGSLHSGGRPPIGSGTGHIGQGSGSGIGPGKIGSGQSGSQLGIGKLGPGSGGGPGKFGPGQSGSQLGIGKLGPGSGSGPGKFGPGQSGSQLGIGKLGPGSGGGPGKFGPGHGGSQLGIGKLGPGSGGGPGKFGPGHGGPGQFGLNRFGPGSGGGPGKFGPGHGPNLPGLGHQKWINDHHKDLHNRLVGMHHPGHHPINFHQPKHWHPWMGGLYHHHGYWHHGYWDRYWDRYWYRWWGLYPGFVITPWMTTWIGWDMGLYAYTNPYWVAGPTVVYDYSQPMFASAPAGTEVTAGADPNAAQPGATELEYARQSFYLNDYSNALGWADEAVRKAPSDAVAHEFRALCQFALGDYRGAAATLNAVLAAGPGWNWETMASLYPDVSIYTGQLRKLEQYVDGQPSAGDARFVLAYHYLVTGAQDASVEQLKEVVALVPNDGVARQLLQMLAPPEPTPQAPSGGTAPGALPPLPAQSGPSITAEQLAGTWKATGEGGTKFELTLDTTGAFTWKYTHQGQEQVVKGVFAVDGQTLAMEPESGGTMLAQIVLQGKDSFEFKPIGSEQLAQSVKFSR